MFRPPAPAPAGPAPVPVMPEEPPERPSPPPPAPVEVLTPPPAPETPPVAPVAYKGTKTIPAAALMIISATIALEGGYVKNPFDPGGETNMGITKQTAQRNGYNGPMRTLPRGVAESIYYKEYMVKPGYAPLVALDAPVAEELFDTTANMGAARPSRWFEQAVNQTCGTHLRVDGHLGSAAIAAYGSCQQKIGAATMCVTMLNRLDASQLAEYKRLVRANPKLQRFYRGWTTNRINNVDRRKCSGGPK